MPKHLERSPDSYLNQMTPHEAFVQHGKHAEAETGMSKRSGAHMVKHPMHGSMHPAPHTGHKMGHGIKKKYSTGE